MGCGCGGHYEPDYEYLTVWRKTSSYYYTRGAMVGGSSGGPLIDKSGEVVGVLKGGSDEDRWPRLKHIHRLLERKGYSWLVK